MARFRRLALGVRGAAGHTEPVLADVALGAVSSAVTEWPAGAFDTHLVEKTVVI